MLALKPNLPVFSAGSSTLIVAAARAAIASSSNAIEVVGRPMLKSSQIDAVSSSSVPSGRTNTTVKAYVLAGRTGWITNANTSRNIPSATMAASSRSANGRRPPRLARMATPTIISGWPSNAGIRVMPSNLNTPVCSTVIAAPASVKLAKAVPAAINHQACGTSGRCQRIPTTIAAMVSSATPPRATAPVAPLATTPRIPRAPATSR